MPYATDHHGIYRIVNNVTMECYVGGTKNLKKRAAEHFRLLRLGAHPNKRLQESFSLYGEESFFWEVEVFCEDPSDLDALEELFLSGEAVFPEPAVLNISRTAKRPMAGRSHDEETRKRISESRCKNTSYMKDPAYRDKLRAAQLKRFMSNEDFVKRVRFIVENPDLSYAERGRQLGMDTGSVRKLALKYSNLRGKI